ncbi:MAG: DUF819 domain-containing protein [Victivallaceae bacterium]|nr:DUF819 family protein [Victivallaceae bacterium]
MADYIAGFYPITSGFGYLSLLVFTAGLLKFAESKATGKWLKGFFNYVPAVVCLYLITMLMGSLHLWAPTEEITHLASGSRGVTAYLLPSMIFLLLLKSDLRQIAKLGPRMIFVFVVAAFTMMVGFIAGYIILAHNWEAGAWKSLASLCGSWIGGNVNMVAVQRALGMPDRDMAYVLSIDTVSYSVWLLVMMLAVPFSKIFDRWTRADASKLEKVIRKLEKDDNASRGSVNFANMIFLVGLAMGFGALCFTLADVTAGQLAGFAGRHDLLACVGEKPLWQVIYATVFGLGCGMTRLGRIPGSSELGNTLMYIFIAVIGSKADLTQLDSGKFIVYLEFGALVLLIHFGLLMLAAKLFKFDAYSCQTASLANIGGVASATVISGAYSVSLVPIGVLMATLGTILGTAGGIIVGNVLKLLQ